MPTYSKQLFSVNSTTAGVTVYTSPVGIVTVVRDIEAVNATSSTDSLNIYLTSVPGSASTFIFKVNQLAPGNSSRWEGRAVLAAGQSIQLYSGAAGWTVLCSGYELSG